MRFLVDLESLYLILFVFGVSAYVVTVNERRVRKVVINKISFFIAVLLYFLYDYIRIF